MRHSSGELAVLDDGRAAHSLNNTARLPEQLGVGDFYRKALAALGTSVKSVESASPGVSLAENSVRLHDGDSMNVLISQEGRHQLSANIVDGTLAVDVWNNQLTASASGKWWLKVPKGKESAAFTYAGNGFADLVKLSKIGSIIVLK